MKERAEQIGATFTISSEPGKGTKVMAVSPNKAETAELVGFLELLMLMSLIG